MKTLSLAFALILALSSAAPASAAEGEPEAAVPEGFATAPAGAFDVERAPAPLFRDPIYDGAADPSMLYKRDDGSWWIFYSQRRANQPLAGVAWCYGTKIGIAKSTDRGRTWEYRGTCDGLTRGKQTDTYWAPHVFEHDGVYHMYVTYFDRIADTWGGDPQLHHYVSKDLASWEFADRVDVKSDHIIDAAVIRLPDGRWLLVFRDDEADVRTAMCVSDDLKNWTRLDTLTGDRKHEGPVMMFWKERYWMVVDDWAGLGVYVSDDGINYERNGTILAEGGRRPEDGVKGGHAGLFRTGDRAFVVYFVHPDRLPGHKEWQTDNTLTYEDKRTSLQVAELGVDADGKLTCDRDRYAK